MHVSFVKAKALPGKRQAILDHMEKWEREQQSSAKGWIRSYLAASNSNPDEIMGAIVWDDTANYLTNANRPEQDAWYRELRAMMVSDPEWFDGTLLREGVATAVGARF